MDEAQARKLFQTGDSGTNVLPPGTMPTPAAAQASFGVGGKPRSFEERNSRGLPIDMTEGAKGAAIVGAEWRDKPEEKVKYLESVYGAGNVRMADDGTPLIKVVGNDNKPKEIPLSAKGLQFADVASMSAYIPETIGAILAMRGGRRLPFLGKVGEATEAKAGARMVGFGRDVTAEAVGQEAGGAMKDVGVSVLDHGTADVGEIVSERAGRLPADMAVGAGLGVVGKMVGKAITPTEGARGQLEAEMQQARQYFKDAYGIDFPLTAGERTGSSILKRTEATMTRLPGSSGEFADIRTEKTDRIRRIMNRIMGQPEDLSAAERAALPSEEAVGQKAIAAVRQQIDPTQRAIEASRNQVVRESNQRIMAELESATTADRQLYPEKVGEAIRTKAHELRGQFQEQSSKLYADSYSLPGGTDRTLAAPSLPGQAQKLLDALPQKTKTIESVGYDAYGSPVLKTREGKEVLKEFVPPNVAGKLQSLADLKGQKFSLKDLVAMRTEVANDIAQGEAIPGVQTHYLGKIRETLTSAIEEATDSLPDGNLKASWKAANDFYKQNVGKFHEGPIARLFKDIESRGFIANEDIIRNIGPTEYAAFKKFLGPTSPEFGQLKRAIVDQLIGASTLPGETLISGPAFLKELSNLEFKNKAIADDIFGVGTEKVGVLGRKSRMAQLAQVMDAAESWRTAGNKIDAEKFRALLDSDAPLRESVEKLVKEQATLDKAYRSQIIKDIGEKKLGESLDATDFVNRFYSTASPAELKSVIAQLQDTPLTLEDLRRKVVEKTLSDAQRAIKDTDPSKLGRGELFRPSGSKQMDNVFGTEQQRERLQIMLGNRTYNDLVNLSQLLRAGEVTEAAFASAGGLSAGMQVANMLRGGVFSYAADWAKQKVAAVMLTSPGFRQWIGNTAMSRADQVSMTRAFIASAPFVEAIAGEFKSDAAAAEFIGGLQRSVNAYEKYGGNTGGPVETPKSKEDRARILLRENAPKVRPIPAAP